MAKKRKQKRAKMKWFDWVLSILAAIGLLNWGLVAWFKFDLIEWLSFGQGWLATTLYSAVGVLGVLAVARLIMLLSKR